MGIIDHAPLDATENLFIVMPHAAGKDLSKRPKLYEGLPDTTLAVAEQLAEALAHAHAHGVIHRDVKPANILFSATNDHACLLSDFGICFVDSMQPATSSAEWVGARAYIAPELEGGGAASAAADVYSLGKVIYFMLSGGVDLPREAHRERKYDLFARGPKWRAIGVLLDAMICPVATRISTMADALDRVRRIRAMNLDDSGLPFSADTLAALAAAAARDRERMTQERSNAETRAQRLMREREVITEVSQVVQAAAERIVETVNAMQSDHLSARILEMPWTPNYETMGEQQHPDRLVVEAVVPLHVERKTGTFRLHTLALSICRVERPVVAIRDGVTHKENPDGRLAVVPVYEMPGSPNFSGFLAPRERIPPASHVERVSSASPPRGSRVHFCRIPHATRGDALRCGIARPRNRRVIAR